MPLILRNLLVCCCLGALIAPALGGCTGTPFRLTVQNDGSAGILMDATGNVVPNLDYALEQGGQWVDVLEDVTCMRQCVQPRPRPCPAIAFIPQLFALMPGESFLVEHDGEAAVAGGGGTCWNRAWMTSGVRVELCAAERALDFEGEEILPEDTGLVNDDMGNGYERLVDPACTALEFDLEEEQMPVLSINLDAPQ